MPTKRGMSEKRLGFWARLAMFFWLPWKVLFQPTAAWLVREALAEPEAEAGAVEEERKSEDALRLLAILQRDGRLVDFLQEDISGAPDEQVGAAARIVHEGCRKALAEYITLRPLREEGEGEPITIPPGFDATEIRLSGNVVGEPPYRGRLAHPGWKAVEVRLPTATTEIDPTIVAPAEVEV